MAALWWACGQSHHHLRENALVAPPLPTVVQCLMGTILLGSVAPPQAIAIDENNPAQYTPIIPLGPLLRNALPGKGREACRGTLGNRAQDAPSARRSTNKDQTFHRSVFQR